MSDWRGGGGGGGRGRGAYYKAKYGGGGRGRGGGGGGEGGPRPYPSAPHGDAGDDDPVGRAAAGSDDEGAAVSAGVLSGSGADLVAALRRIEGRGYKAYKDIEGAWDCGEYTLLVDWVQGDPFASPSRCRVLLPARLAALPPALVATKTRRIAVCDFLTRSFGLAVAQSGGDIRRESGGWQGEKGGEMGVDRPGQHVLERSSVLVHPDGSLEARFTVALPARGRSVLGQWAASILTQNLPRYVRSGLHYGQQDRAALQRHVECVEDTAALRAALPGLGLVAFVGDGAILPRRSGASDEPMAGGEAVPFRSPPSLALTVALPNAGEVRGMGVPAGVTLIVGGGFHGKSTLLQALEAGVYDKVPGDGRELVACDPTGVKIRAEDGRRVEAVDISPFISNLPFGRPTADFRSADASGSTSQAANIQEALELGSRLLLLDEDTSATNFMIRDARMQELVSGDKEPITPFVAKIRALAARGTSTVLVIGGSGEYFDAADAVIAMDCYAPRDVTAEAHAIAARHGAAAAAAGAAPVAAPTAEYGTVADRTVLSIHSRPAPGPHGRDLRVKVRGLHALTLDQEELELGGLEQLVEVSQARAVGDALLRIRRQLAAGAWRGRSLADVVAALDAEMDEAGLDALAGGKRPGNLARPRRFELAAAVSRLRSAQLAQLRPRGAPGPPLG